MNPTHRPTARESSPTTSARPVPAFKAGDPVPGLSSWLLERKLGGGGFGAVWLARHAIDRERKPVAFKFCTDPDARHRLVTHERNVVARVMQHAGKHPNIVRLLEYNLDGAVPWLMYEFVEGGTLAALAEEWQALPLAKRLGRAVKVLHQIAGALAAMHRLNPPIVHRDLKPANILMAGAVPRITDFGIGSVALPQGSAPELTAGAAKLPTDMLRSGTKLYSSPEQRFGAPALPRDDVFSLGVIAWQFVSGDAYGQPGTDALAYLRDLKVPTELASLIVRSTAFNPERRPKDGGEWEATLGALIARFRSQPEASTASVPVLIAESGSVPGLVPTSVPPAQANTSSPSEPYVVPSPLPTRAGSEPDIETERAEEWPEEAKKRRRGLLALFLVACVALAGALFLAVRDPKPNELAKQPEVPAPKPKKPEPKVLPKPKNVPTFPANPKAGDEYDIEIAPNTKMRFCYIPAGECQLGSPKTEAHRVNDEDEDERGKFSTKGFWMGKYEVTQAEWAAVMRGTALETPSNFRIGGAEEKALGTIRDTSRFPVEFVSWDHCQDFLKRVDAHRALLGDKGALDLPHEDEWEYACRGGLGNKRPFYFGDALNGTQANCNGEVPFGTTPGDFLKRPQPVGSYEAKARHPWGLCDMHGNVWEWCRNSYDNNNNCVLRGGSWIYFAHGCRAARRDRYEPANRAIFIGFRLLSPCT
jgi:formylglycine-generating enzyme required for sulfatase activity/tRNA A-37 threonylcarbamoyl transferase component Bud32